MISLHEPSAPTETVRTLQHWPEVSSSEFSGRSNKTKINLNYLLKKIYAFNHRQFMFFISIRSLYIK